ncbi:MAG: TetR/AcrR family transcriptional regulator [Gemmatimonadales bacterium]|nr:TetR/AcrR family transcriptional regulator [Gemmatimonadales bacterium]
MSQSDAPRDRLIGATLECFERFGMEGTTVRRIADLAGVNVAAVNYYFGSKDRLVDEALAASLNQVFPDAGRELAAAIEAESGDVRRGTARFLREFFQVAFKWPRTAYAHLHLMLADQDYDGPAVTAFRRFVSDFLGVIEPAMPEPDPKRRRALVYQVWSSFLLTAIAPAVLPDLLADEDFSLYLTDGMIRLLFGHGSGNPG